MIDDTYDSEVEGLHYARLFAAGIQRIRKNSWLHPWDKVQVLHESNQYLSDIAETHMPLIHKTVRVHVRPINEYVDKYETVAGGMITVGPHKAKIIFIKA